MWNLIFALHPLFDNVPHNFIADNLGGLQRSIQAELFAKAIILTLPPEFARMRA
jgi:hypothetical protein